MKRHNIHTIGRLITTFVVDDEVLCEAVLLSYFHLAAPEKVCLLFARRPTAALPFRQTAQIDGRLTNVLRHVVALDQVPSQPSREPDTNPTQPSGYEVSDGTGFVSNFSPLLY